MLVVPKATVSPGKDAMGSPEANSQGRSGKERVVPAGCGKSMKPVCIRTTDLSFFRLLRQLLHLFQSHS